MEFNNVYEFLSWMIVYTSTNFTGFMILLTLCLTTIFIFASLANFRLFEVRNTKLDGNTTTDKFNTEDRTHNVQNSDDGYIIYDMLMKAYNKYKKD